MSNARFRWLLVAYVVITVGAATAFLVPGGYSEELANAFAQEPDPWLLRDIRWTMAIGISLLLATIVGLVGLFLLRRWGRAVSLYSTIAGLLLYLFSGPEVTSALERTLFEASALLWGAILALAYHSPVADRFGAKNASRPEPLRDSAQPDR